LTVLQYKEVSFMKSSHLFLIISGLFLLASCGPQRYAVAPGVEDDDLYYSPGDTYITDYGAVSDDSADNGAAEAADGDYDYYDPNAPQQNIPSFGNRSINPRMNQFNQPRFSLGLWSAWNRPGMNMGMGFNNPMPSSYFYGYSAFGSPMWNDPWMSPWGMNCYGNGMGFNSWNSPWGWNDPWGWNYPFAANNGWGWNNGWGMNPWNNPWNSPWNNPWNSPWFGNDLWTNNPNMHYGQRQPIYSEGADGNAYGSGQIYNGTPKRQVQPDSEPRKSSRTTYSTPEYDYYRPSPNRNATRPATNQRSTTPRQGNNGSGWTWDNFFDGNDSFNRGNTPRPSGGSTSPSRPSRGNSGGYTPRSPSRNSGGSSPSRSTGRSKGGGR
jgi:hypothetical protein